MTLNLVFWNEVNLILQTRKKLTVCQKNKRNSREKQDYFSECIDIFLVLISKV